MKNLQTFVIVLSIVLIVLTVTVAALMAAPSKGSCKTGTHYCETTARGAREYVCDTDGWAGPYYCCSACKCSREGTGGMCTLV